jgi:hypothetical protein
MEINNQKGGNGSQNIQGRNVTVNVINIVQSVKDIAPQILESSFGELSPQSKERAHNNQDDFVQNFQSKLEKIAGNIDELKEEVDKPDFQYMAKKSLIAAGRIDSAEKRKLLASLLGDRLNTKTDFGEIVYNEALETIPKLTDKQIKIIALHCYITAITGKKSDSWKEFNDNNREIFNFLLPIVFKYSDLQHITYSGCGSLNQFGTGLIEAIKKNDENLFLNPIKPVEPEYKEIDNSGLISFFIKEDKNLFFRISKDVFEKIIKTANGVDKSITDKISKLYDSKVMNDSESINTLKEKCLKANELIDAWDNGKLKYLSLTSVGMIIAASVIEEITKDKISKDEWLGIAPVQK